jgi:hypothetical protein
MLRRRWVILVCCFVCSALGASAAGADPNPENNKQALSRTLLCDNGETLAATFAGLEGSNFNVTIDRRSGPISPPRLPPEAVLEVRGIQRSR